MSANAATVPASETAGPPRLRRVLGLTDLIFYGIVLIQPIGAVGPFGLANKMSLGHVTTTILIALVAMMLTALSYGRMAGLYPAAGSAYTYVGRGLNPYLGFIAGWAMFLDYLVIPIVSIVYGSLSLQRVLDAFAPGFSQHLGSALGFSSKPEHGAFVVFVVVLTALMTFLNLRGIKWTAHANQVMTAVMFLVIAWFTVEAIRYLAAKQGMAGLFSSEPFYNPRTFNLGAVGTATSLAALTYIGFDGITTLSEDVKDPKRTVPLSIVLVCMLIGFCAFLEVYLAQRVWPDYATFKDLDTAFFDVCEVVGGKPLFHALALVMAIACLGSALTGQVGAARILFGMGRDNALPRIFARLDRHNNPVLNLWLIGGLCLAGALLLNYEKAATLINFGAFLAFLGVNLAVIREFFFRPMMEHKNRERLQSRMGRGPYWHVSILLGIAGGIVCLKGFEIIASTTRIWITVLQVLFLCLVSLSILALGLALQIKRWHDRGKSGWWVLINLLPLVGPVWSVVELGFLKGTTGPNQFGNRPPSASFNSHIINMAIPATAFLFCLWIWLSLPVVAQICGGAWCVIGLIYSAITTRGFRTPPKMIDLNL